MVMRQQGELQPTTLSGWDDAVTAAAAAATSRRPEAASLRFRDSFSFTSLSSPCLFPFCIEELGQDFQKQLVGDIKEKLRGVGRNHQSSGAKEMKGPISALVFTTVWFLASWGPQFSRNTENPHPIVAIAWTVHCRELRNGWWDSPAWQGLGPLLVLV